MSNVLINGQHLTDIADAIRAKSGSEETFLPSELAPAINNLTTEEKWVRPAEWANFDLLSPDDHAVYMTIDNRVPPTTLGVYGWGYYYLQRVQINNDGTVDILESSASNRGGLTISIPAEAGDYPVYRVKAVDTELTEFSLEGNEFRWHKILERWFNLPNATVLGVGYSYRNIFNSNVVAETFVDFPINCKAFDFSNEYSLKSVRNLSSKPLPYYSHNSNYALQYTEGSFIYSGGTTLANRHTNCYCLKEINLSSANMTSITSLQGAFESCLSAKSIILPDIDYSSLTAMQSMCRYCRQLESFTFPEGDYSKVTNISNIFQECYALDKPIILPKTLTCNIGQMAFGSCLHLPCVVILSETLMPLNNVNAFQNLYTSKRNFRVYVRQSLIEEYQTATNWATIYAANPNFFQPIEGSEWEYLLEE